jgi:hypothetical protein
LNRGCRKGKGYFMLTTPLLSVGGGGGFRDIEQESGMFRAVHVPNFFFLRSRVGEHQVPFVDYVDKIN